MGEKPVCAEVCLTDAIRFGEKELLKMELAPRARRS